MYVHSQRKRARFTIEPGEIESYLEWMIPFFSALTLLVGSSDL